MSKVSEVTSCQCNFFFKVQLICFQVDMQVYGINGMIQA